MASFEEAGPPTDLTCTDAYTMMEAMSKHPPIPEARPVKARNPEAPLIPYEFPTDGTASLAVGTDLKSDTVDLQPATSWEAAVANGFPKETTAKIFAAQKVIVVVVPAAF